MTSENTGIKEFILRLSLSMVALFMIFLSIGVSFNKEIFGSVAENPKKEEARIKGAIILFNKIFTDLYVSGGVPAMLDEFPASKQMRHELFRDIGFLRGGNRVLVYDMADLIFKDIKRPAPNSAEVTTFEEWNYVYQRAGTRETAKSIRGLGGGFRYFMHKKKGQWLVVNYEPVDIKHKKKDEFLY